MAKRVTIKDIAAECGVSLSTVSLVLNNHPRISEATRNKVLEAVRKHRYQPNTQARGLASKSSRAVSVVVPHLNQVFADVYLGEIISGIYEGAQPRQYKVLLDVANLKFIRTREHLNILKSRRADGMLFVASTLYDQYLRVFEDEPYPFLLVNHYFPGSRLNFLCTDYRQSARLAAAHLLELGHRRIGIIGGSNIQTAVDFTETFRQSCRERGVPDHQVPWEDGQFNEHGGFKAARKLLAEHPNLTALMAGNDKMAIGAMRFLQTAGLRIPEQISVMGMDDLPASAFTTPGLSTIHQPIYDLGKAAAERLIALFRGEIRTCREFLPVHLVTRESTGPAPK